MGRFKRVRPDEKRPVKKAAHFAHTMVRGLAPGWFVCRVCGLVAVCPGCVSLPNVFPIHLCSGHQSMAGHGVMVVWATDESAR